MKKIIPFNNVVNFNTDVKEITAISLEHEIKKYPDMICGVFYISGEYKITEGLLEKEKFNFELPFDIALTNNYELDSLLVDIDDFRYELISDKDLKVNIDLYIDGEEIQIPEPRYIYTEDLMKEDTTTILNNEPEKTDRTENIDEDKDTTNFKHNFENTNQSNLDEIYEVENNIELNNININNQNQENNKNNQENINDKITKQLNETLLDDALEIMEQSNIDTKYLTKNNDIEPERIELLKDMLTNNDKENDMNKDINLNINNNETNNINDSNNQSIANDLFTPTTEDKYTTYRVYKVVETDTIDTILTKYNITKEMLADYNNIENINPGDKLIIPTNEK